MSYIIAEVSNINMYKSYQSENVRREPVLTSVFCYIPPKTNQNDKILLDEDEFSDQTALEMICPSCNTNTIVTITDQAGNSDKFCKRCNCVYSEENDIIRHRQRLLPPQENEVAASTTPTVSADDVAIRHPPTLKDGAAQLAKRGTIKFTYYYDSSEH
jgi:hypothetical protein